MLDEYEHERADDDIDVDMGSDAEEGEEKAKKINLPSEHTRMRLNRLFSSSLTNALESLHPRLLQIGLYQTNQNPTYSPNLSPISNNNDHHQIHFRFSQ